jgi:arginase
MQPVGDGRANKRTPSPRLSTSVAVSEIRLLIVPYELDRLRRGVGSGPERLLEAGAAEELASAGTTVRTETLELDREYSSETLGCFELIKRVAARVRAATGDGAFPVVLSGSCFASVGVVAALGKPTGVVWFDAHGDFNTPETTDFGYFDGMGLAVLTGGAWRTMLAGVDGATPLPESAIVLAGARDFDPYERERVETSGVVHLPPERLRTPDALLEATKAMSPSPSGIHVHVDLDVLDADEARVNVYSAANGVSGAELESLVTGVFDSAPVRALSVTAYDPKCDPADAVPPIANRLLRAAAEGLPETQAAAT